MFRNIDYAVVLPILFIVSCSQLLTSITSAEISLRLAKQMSRVSSAEEFMRRFVVTSRSARTKTTPVDSTGQGRASSRSRQVEVKSSEDDTGIDVMVSLSPQEGCKPRDTVVAIPPDPNPNVLLWPTCVSVRRCGGCCLHSALICTPTVLSNTTVQISKSTFLTDSTDYLQSSGIIQMVLESHVACDCTCRVKPSDCNVTSQRYDGDTCQCLCLTVTSCVTPKQWNSKQCTCVCPKILDCFDDEYFNYSTCTCRRFAQLPRLSESSSSKSTSPAAAAAAAAAVVSASPCPGLHCLSGYEPSKTIGHCVCTPISAPKKNHRRSSIRTDTIQ